MGSAGYRFVEINTYLAKVTKVTAASTDRNGHVTDATVDRKVYQVNDTGIDKAGVEAEGFTVGQYVLVTMTVDTTVSLADNLISPLPPALNTTNSAATLVMSTCERSNSIAALAAVVTSGPASFKRQLASRAAATSCCTAVTAEVSALVFSVSSWLLSAVSSLCVRSFGHLDEVRFFPVGKSVVGCTFQCKILRYDRNKKALPKQCFRVS